MIYVFVVVSGLLVYNRNFVLKLLENIYIKCFGTFKVNKTLGAFSANEIKVKELKILHKYVDNTYYYHEISGSAYDYNIEYYTGILKYIFYKSDIFPKMNEKGRYWQLGDDDMLIVNYNYNGVDYSINFKNVMNNKFYSKSENILNLKLNRVKLHNNELHKKILSSSLHNSNDEENITNILRRYIGPNYDFYRYFDIDLTNITDILYEYNLKEWKEITIIDTFGEETTLDLNQLKHINWNNDIIS